MPNYNKMEVKTVFTAKDQMSAPMRKMGNSSKRLAGVMGRSMSMASRHALSFKGTMAAVFGGNMLTRATMYLQRGVGNVTDEFIQLDGSITRAAAKFPEKIERGSKAFGLLRKAAQNVGKTTEFTASQAAIGLETYAKAGFDAATSMKLLAGTAELATNAGVDFETSAKNSIDTLTAFDLQTNNSEQNLKNLARVNDVLTTVTTSANLDFEDFAETLQKTGAIAKSSGASIESMATMTGLVAKAGIRGSIAGTTLKNMYLNLSGASAGAAKGLKKLGVTVNDGTGNMRDALDILIDYKKATQHMGTLEQNRYKDMIFGKRAIAGVGKIVSINVEELEKYRKKLLETKGAAASMAKKIRLGLKNQIEVMRSAAMAKGMSVIDQMLGGGDPAKMIERLTKKINEFDIKPLAKGLKTALSLTVKFTKFIYKHAEAIKAAAKAYLVFKLAMTSLNISNSVAQNLMGLSATMAGAGKAGGSALMKGIAGKIAWGGPVIVAALAGLAIGKIISDYMQAEEKKLQKKKSKDVLALRKDIFGADKMSMSALEKRRDFLGKKVAGYQHYTEARRKQGLGDALQNSEQERRRKDIFAAYASVENAYGNKLATQQRGGDYANPDTGKSTEMLPDYLIKQDQKIEVDVQVNNAPEGTTATATIRKAPPINAAMAGAL